MSRRSGSSSNEATRNAPSLPNYGKFQRMEILIVLSALSITGTTVLMGR